MAENKKKSGTGAKTDAIQAPEKKKNSGKRTSKTGKNESLEKEKPKTKKKPLLSSLTRFSIRSSTVMLTVKGTVVVAAIFSLLLLVLVSADLRPSAIVQGAKNKYAFVHASGEGFPVEIPGGRILDVSKVKNGTAVLTAARCTVYDKKGREVTAANHMLSSPAMESAGGYILLHESLGRDYSLRAISGECCKGETENSIVCADVSESGVFAFVTTSDTNNARLVVYSFDGNVIHRWKSVNYNISDVAVSPSGKYVAVCGFSTQNGALVSTVIVQQVGGRENLKEMSVEGTMIVDIEFRGNNKIVAVGDDLAAYLSVKNDDNSIYGYDDRILNCYNLSDDGDLALVFSEYSDGRNSSVVVIDEKCREKANIATSMTSPYVDLDDGRINLLYQSEVTSYNYKGKLLFNSDVQADCKTIFTSGERLLARGVMYLNEVG